MGKDRTDGDRDGGRVNASVAPRAETSVVRLSWSSTLPAPSWRSQPPLGRGPCAVVCQSPLEGFGVILLSRMRPRRVGLGFRLRCTAIGALPPDCTAVGLRRLFGRFRYLGFLRHRRSAPAGHRRDLVSDAMRARATKTGFRRSGPIALIKIGDYSTFLEQPARGRCPASSRSCSSACWSATRASTSSSRPGPE